MFKKYLFYKDISKEKFILENYPDKVRETIKYNEIEDRLDHVQEWAKIFMFMGNVKGVILCTKLQNYFKDMLKILK